MFRNLSSLLVFITVLISLEVYIHYAVKNYYLKTKSKGRSIVKYAYFTLLILSSISISVMIIWGNAIKVNILNFFIATVFINLLSKLLFLPFVLIDDLRRFFIYLKHKISPSDVKVKDGISRSDFLTKMGIAVATVPALSLPFGMIYGPYNYTLHRKKVKSPNLPKAFHGLKIAQLSDIHVRALSVLKNI